MDYYLDDEHVYERLKKNYLNHDKLIIAYDFDNTVYPVDENHCSLVINLLKRWRPYAKFIVFTSRNTDEPPICDMVVDYLDELNIPWDYINENIDGLGFETGRKIYYNVLLDDRTGLSCAYDVLSRLIGEIERGEI